ncbi:MAG: efflux RND transporter periplasmic adaptor subunit, partial [Sedimentisphaerales bacterium]|nr:efflux RND transporter periplasmic adaptor subunit [Sedimentisphaerales bacterium]
NIGLKTAIAGADTIHTTVKAYGELKLNRDKVVYISTPIAGIVSRINANLGDEITVNSPLATLESRELAELRAEYLAASTTAQIAEKTFTRENELWQNQLNSQTDIFASEEELAHARIYEQLTAQKLLAVGYSMTELDKLKQNNMFLADYELKSPINGTLLEKNCNIGELISEGNSPSFVIADLKTLWADVYLPAGLSGKIDIDQEITISPEAQEQSIRAKIFYISPVVNNETQTIFARTLVNNEAGKYRANDFITAEIVVDEQRKPVVIAKDAVQTMADGKYVFVLRHDGFEMIQVTVGLSGADTVEITSGLSVGDEYVTQGAFALKSRILTATLDSHAGHGH